MSRDSRLRDPRLRSRQSRIRRARLRDASCALGLPLPPGSPFPNYSPTTPHSSIEVAAFRALQEGEQRLEEAGDQITPYILSLAKRCKQEDPATAALHEIVLARSAGKKRRVWRLIDKYAKRRRSSGGRSFHCRQRKHLAQAKSLRATLQLATRAVGEAVDSLGASGL